MSQRLVLQPTGARSYGHTKSLLSPWLVGLDRPTWGVTANAGSRMYGIPNATHPPSWYAQPGDIVLFLEPGGGSRAAVACGTGSSVPAASRRLGEQQAPPCTNEEVQAQERGGAAAAPAGRAPSPSSADHAGPSRPQPPAPPLRNVQPQGHVIAIGRVGRVFLDDHLGDRIWPTRLSYCMGK